MDNKTVRTNRTISDALWNKAAPMLGAEPVLFAVAGDLNLKAKYADAMLWYGSGYRRPQHRLCDMVLLK